MNKPYSNECEIKFRVDSSSADEYKDRLLKLGFTLSDSHIETDFIPDTEDFKCKKNNMVLRYRFIEPNRKRYILTLKIRRLNDKFQDSLEIEYSSDDYDPEKHTEINRILSENIKMQVPAYDASDQDLMTIVSKLYSAGFVTCRMLSQKHRVTYKKGDVSVCFDSLPKRLGMYMEIEAFSEKDLDNIINLLKPDISRVENRSYGTLIQDLLAEKGAIEKQKRVCVFDPELEQEIFKLFGLA